MFESFYRLKTDPFLMSPDHRFAFAHESYDDARQQLQYGMKRGEGIVVITGHSGTGKSTLVEDLLSNYKAQQGIAVGRVLSTQMDSVELLRMVAFSFGLKPEFTDKASVLIAIQQFVQQRFAEQSSVLLIVDEAQDLTEQGLETLRQLTNIKNSQDQRFQLLLLGQPALRELIRRPEMEQLRQRIIAYCHLEALSLEATREYIGHRLVVAGWNGDPVISASAIALIHRFSRGIPRRINLICSRLLLVGMADQKHQLDDNDVREVMGQLTPEMLESAILLESETERLATEKSSQKIYEHPFERRALTSALDAAISLDTDDDEIASGYSPDTVTTPLTDLDVGRAVKVAPMYAHEPSDQDKEQLSTQETPIANELPQSALGFNEQPKKRRGVWVVLLLVTLAGAFAAIERDRLADRLQALDVDALLQTTMDRVTQLLPNNHAEPNTLQGGVDMGPSGDTSLEAVLPEATILKDTVSKGTVSENIAPKKGAQPDPLEASEALPVGPDEVEGVDSAESNGDYLGALSATEVHKTLGGGEQLDSFQVGTDLPAVEANRAQPPALLEQDPVIDDTPEESQADANSVASKGVDAGVVLRNGQLVVSGALQLALQDYSHWVTRLDSGALSLVPLGLDREGAKDFPRFSESVDSLAYILRNYSGLRFEVVVPDVVGVGTGAPETDTFWEDLLINRLVKGGVEKSKLTKVFVSDQTLSERAPLPLPLPVLHVLPESN